MSGFVSMPVGDLLPFRDPSGRFIDVSVPADDHFGILRIDRKSRGFAPGHITRQLVELSVQYPSEARNHLILDSDTYFRGHFVTKGFIDSDGIGLTVLAEDKDLLADPGYASFAEIRAKKINLIADRLGAPTLSRDTCLNNAVFQDSVRHDFRDWCCSESLCLVDLITIAPVEFNWYSLFLVKHGPKRLVRIEPFLRMMHTRCEYRRLAAVGFSHESLRTSSLGVCLNSGWASTRQGHFLSRLDRGSWAATLAVRGDRVRHGVAWGVRLFHDARLPGALRRGSQAPEQMS
jgi:hypothetical protein